MVTRDQDRTWVGCVLHCRRRYVRLFDLLSVPEPRRAIWLEAATVAPMPVLKRDAMVRKGEAGVQKDVGMTSEITASIKSWADIFVPDSECRRTLITAEAPRARETSLAWHPCSGATWHTARHFSQLHLGLHCTGTRLRTAAT